MLLVGDDWASDHHDVVLMDESGTRVAKARLPEGIAGIIRLHAMIGEHLGDDEDAEVRIGIETDRGPWVAALIAAGYTVYAVNPLQAARFRERRSVSGAKSDAGDAHSLADMVRTDAHQLRSVAGDSPAAQAVKVLARIHKTMIWERTRHTQRLKHALREYFPAAIEAFPDLDAPEALELLGKAPDPQTAARLSLNQIKAALKRAGRRGDLDEKAAGIQAVLRGEQLGRVPLIAAAYAAGTRATIAVLVTLDTQVKALHGEVEAHFGRHPDAEIIGSQPGLGQILGARVLAEFGDDHTRYASAKARKNYAATSPITRASGKSKVVVARFVHQDRLVDALLTQAFCALKASPGARAYYDKQRGRGPNHNAALRHVANRLVGILHGCLKSRTLYDETTAWAAHEHHESVAA
ncbi:IS110 family transposase [Nocardia sp. CA-107356]|uniref:IS110 family transposase n=1 Tax=Nocardia sp. CA-107356 TaxID=3239972 RepID=UPI003D9428F6